MISILIRSHLKILISHCQKKRVKPTVLEISDFLRVQKPTIIGLQEVFSRSFFRELLEEAKRENYHVAPESFSKVKANGLVFIMNSNFGKVVDLKFEPFDSKRFGKDVGILQSTVELPNGKLILIANTHVHFSTQNAISDVQLSHFKQISEFALKKTSEMPTVILGDFNAGPNLTFGDKPFKGFSSRIWEAPSGINYLLTRLGLNLVSNRNLSTWVNSNLLVKEPPSILKIFFGSSQYHESDSTIDHIFASKEFFSENATIAFHEDTEVECKVNGNTLSRTNISDHFGAVVDLELE